MWTLVYAFVVFGQVYQYQMPFETYSECTEYAKVVLPYTLEGVDNDNFAWTCV